MTADSRELTVVASQDGDSEKTFQVSVQIDTATEWEYCRNGGILYSDSVQSLAIS